MEITTYRILKSEQTNKYTWFQRLISRWIGVIPADKHDYSLAFHVNGDLKTGDWVRFDNGFSAMITGSIEGYHRTSEILKDQYSFPDVTWNEVYVIGRSHGE